jgi:hypothetical protein
MGAYRLVALNDVARECVPDEGIVLWDCGTPFMLGRSSTKREGWAFPMSMAQLSSRHCTLKPSGEV